MSEPKYDRREFLKLRAAVRRQLVESGFPRKVRTTILRGLDDATGRRERRPR